MKISVLKTLKIAARRLMVPNIIRGNEGESSVIMLIRVLCALRRTENENVKK